MARTRHIQQRMSQRSIQQGWLDLVKTFGTEEGDRISLNRNGIDAAIRAMEKISADLQKMRTRGGVVLVAKDGYEITTYSMDSYKQQTLQ